MPATLLPATVLQEQGILKECQYWVEQAVVGLNLCPFAKATIRGNRLRWRLSSAESTEALSQDLALELVNLSQAALNEHETTIIVHPWVLGNFREYIDFLDVADLIIGEYGLVGVLQIASFHPHYQFAKTSPNDLENYTNRSPHPMLHLLREESIEQATAAFPDASEIYQRNIDTLNAKGRDALRSLYKAAVPVAPC